MIKFFRALKRAADRLDKSTGFDAPPGARPYRSVGDALEEASNVLDALDEDVRLSPRGTYAVGSTKRELDGIGNEAIRTADLLHQAIEPRAVRGMIMSDSANIAQVVSDMAPYVSSGSTALLLASTNPPAWLESKSREEREIIVAEIQRVIDVLGGIGVISTYAADTFERTTSDMWRIRDRVTQPDRKVVMEGFMDALTGVTREGMLGATVKGRNELILRIDNHFTPEQQRSILARIFGQ